MLGYIQWATNEGVKRLNPNEHLAYWLQEQGYQIQLLVMAPKGGAVAPENYIPDGWQLQLQVTRTRAQAGAAANGQQVGVVTNGQTDTSYPSDRVSDMGITAQ